MSKKIKILFRHRSMEMGGVEKVVLNQITHLNQNKFDITLCLNLNQGELRDRHPSYVKKVTLTKGKEDFSKNKWIRKIQLAERMFLLNKFKRSPHKIDKILHSDFQIEVAPTYSAFESVLNSANKKSKKIGWFHSDITLPKLQPLVPKILEQIPKFDFFVFGSQQTKDILVKTYPDLAIPKNKVILNPIPIDEIKESAEKFVPNLPEKINFVSVARLHSRKGFHKLMEAHKHLLNDGFDHQITIIGDGEEYQNLQKQAENLGVTESFIFLGSLLNPYPYVKNADFFILPSESESWPLIIADALLLQKPIISTNVGGIPEMITHKKNGYLINYDTDEMYAAMKEFITNKDLILEIQENLKNSEKQFDNQKIFDEIESVFEELIQ